ncbi:hypothetical protein QF042_000186 [Pedobacter sp. W3I1]|nr:hypothetical protein [Pedobacter sp. W3I1]
MFLFNAKKKEPFGGGELRQDHGVWQKEINYSSLILILINYPSGGQFYIYDTASLKQKAFPFEESFYKIRVSITYFFVESVLAGVEAAGLVLFKLPPSGDGDGVLSKRS